MRSHGVSTFADADSSGEIHKQTPQQLGVSSARFQSANRSCKRLLPNGGGVMSPALVQQMRARALTVARCMRVHGVTSFPDPGSDGHFLDALLHRAEHLPRFQAANDACAN